MARPQRRRSGFRQKAGFFNVQRLAALCRDAARVDGWFCTGFISFLSLFFGRDFPFKRSRVEEPEKLLRARDGIGDDVLSVYDDWWRLVRVPSCRRNQVRRELQGARDIGWPRQNHIGP